MSPLTSPLLQTAILGTFRAGSNQEYPAGKGVSCATAACGLGIGDCCSAIVVCGKNDLLLYEEAIKGAGCARALVIAGKPSADDTYLRCIQRLAAGWACTQTLLASPSSPFLLFPNALRCVYTLRRCGGYNTGPKKTRRHVTINDPSTQGVSTPH